MIESGTYWAHEQRKALSQPLNGGKKPKERGRQAQVIRRSSKVIWQWSNWRQSKSFIASPLIKIGVCKWWIHSCITQFQPDQRSSVPSVWLSFHNPDCVLPSGDSIGVHASPFLWKGSTLNSSQYIHDCPYTLYYWVWCDECISLRTDAILEWCIRYQNKLEPHWRWWWWSGRVLAYLRWPKKSVERGRP